MRSGFDRRLEALERRLGAIADAPCPDCRPPVIQIIDWPARPVPAAPCPTCGRRWSAPDGAVTIVSITCMPPAER